VKKAVVVRLPDGGVELRDWPSWAARVLDEVPVLSDPALPRGAAHDRIFPTAAATKDTAQADEWRRNVHPELFALFASAREIVSKDLAASDRGPRGKLRRLTIPHKHLEGWISALQTARLHLASVFGVDADAMRAPLDQLPDEQRGVVLRIDLLAELQYHMVRGVVDVNVDGDGTSLGEGGEESPPAGEEE
jgi:hypothetical protein